MFYFTVSNTSAVRLVREEGQRLPVLALSHMDIKKNDKIIFLYYPKEWYFKYIDFNNPEINEICTKNKSETEYDIVRLFHSRHPKDAIEKIHKAGGIAVLAHPCCCSVLSLNYLVN